MSHHDNDLDFHLNHISLSQKLLSVPRITRTEDQKPALLAALAQESPHSKSRHVFDPSMDMPSPGTPSRKLKSLADAPVFCYLCGKKAPLRIIHQHHEKCLSDLLDFNPNVLVPKPPETPIPELPATTAASGTDSRSHSPVTRLQRSRSNSLQMPRSRSSSIHRSSNSSLLSSFSTRTANTTSSSGSSSSSSSSTTNLTKMALRLYNAEARDIYFTKRPQEPDAEKKFMSPEMRLLMNESLSGSLSSSGQDYDDTWTMHATSSLRRNSPANKRQMLQNNNGYRIGSNYGVDIYPEQSTLMRGPIPFYGHTSVYIERGMALSFGGYEKQSQMHPCEVTNRLWLFQVDVKDPPSRKRTNKFSNSGKWREVHPLNHAQETIPPRAYHTAVLVRNRLYVYGGETINGEILGDLWCYDLDFKQWAKVPVAWIDPSSSKGPHSLDRSYSARTISVSSPLTTHFFSNGGSGSPSDDFETYSTSRSAPRSPAMTFIYSSESNGSGKSPSTPTTRKSSLGNTNTTPARSGDDSSFAVKDPGTAHPLLRSSSERSILDAQIPPCLKNHTAVVSFKQKYSQKDIPAIPIKRRRAIQKQYKATRDPFHLQCQPDAPNVDVNSRRLVLYGGITSDGEVCRDVWEFDFHTHRWFGHRGPPGRYGHSAVFYPEDNKMIVFGGRDAEGHFLNDVWVYDCSNNVFEKAVVNRCDPETIPLASDALPPPRAFHSCVIDRNLMFVMGGYNDEHKKAIEDIWVLDLYDFQWTKLNYSRPFKPRVHSQICRINEDQFIMTGGMTLPQQTPQRNALLLHFPDPEDESDLDESKLVLSATQIARNDVMQSQINSIVQEMLIDDNFSME